MPASVLLIPTVLAEGATATLPLYVTEAVQQCQILFVEAERTARRFVKTLDKHYNIDEREWVNMSDVNAEVLNLFDRAIADNKTIGVISEAGCPGIADPGQVLVSRAQQKGVTVKPLVGPNSILLALMASGMNGQHFQFVGYLPIDAAERTKAIKALEAESANKDCTQIFIETPYRNNAMLEAILKTCSNHTRLCVAVDITSATESIVTKTIADWKKTPPQLHKRLAVFLLYAGK